MNNGRIRIPSQVKLLGAVSLFTDIASEMLYPVTPIFITAVLGSSMALVGLMDGLAEVTDAAATEGVSKAWVSDLIPDNRRGSAIGLMTSVISLASLSGSLLTGILWDNFGPAVPFFISSAVSLLIAAAFLLMKL